VAELADAQDLGSCPERGAGSTPAVRTRSTLLRRSETEPELGLGLIRVAGGLGRFLLVKPCTEVLLQAVTRVLPIPSANSTVPEDPAPRLAALRH
jgi:hypothetical protein